VPLAVVITSSVMGLQIEILVLRGQLSFGWMTQLGRLLSSFLLVEGREYRKVTVKMGEKLSKVKA